MYWTHKKLWLTLKWSLLVKCVINSDIFLESTVKQCLWIFEANILQVRMQMFGIIFIKFSISILTFANEYWKQCNELWWDWNGISFIGVFGHNNIGLDKFKFWTDVTKWKVRGSYYSSSWEEHECLKHVLNKNFNFRGSSKSLNVILWGKYTSVLNSMRICLSGLTRDRGLRRRIAAVMSSYI